MKISVRFLGFFLAIALMATAASAVDIIKLKSGKVIKGKILEETATHYVMEKFGTKTKYAKSDVAEVKRGVISKDEEYRKMKKNSDMKDPIDLLDLADWCIANGLQRKAERLYERVLRYEPDNEEAHRALGHRKVEGKWLTKEEQKKHDSEKKRKEANKLSGEGDESGDPAPKSSPAGKGVEAKAKAMLQAHKAESKKLAQEMIDEIGLDEVSAAISDHYILAGQIPQKTADELTVLAEKVYADLGARFNHAKDFDLYQALQKKHIILFFKNPTDFSDGYDFAAKKWAPGLMRSKSFAMGSGGGFGSPGLPIDIYKRLEHLKSKVANDVAQDWSFWHCKARSQEAKENGLMEVWLRESMGCWSAIFHTGANHTVRVTQTIYVGSGEIADKRGDEGMRLLAKEWASGKMPANTYSRSLRSLMKQKLNRLNTIDLAIGYSLIEFLIRKHQPSWKKFLIMIRDKPYLEAWREAFGGNLVPDFENKFKKWVLENY